MMKRAFFLLVVIIGLNPFFSPTLWAQYEIPFSNPQTTLKGAKASLDSALQAGNAPLLLKSWLEVVTAQLQISEDSLPSLISQTEGLIAQCSKPSEKAMLNSVAAQMYLLYYDSKRYALIGRLPIQGENPQKINEWSAKELIEAVYNHAVQSLQSADELQKVNISTFKIVLTEGNGSPLFRPTLFDFLAYRAINILKDIPIFSLQKEFPQKTLFTANIIAPIPQFLEVNFDPKSVQVDETVFSIYQQLIRFHTAKNNTAAIIMTNIDRLVEAAPHVRQKSSQNEIDVYNTSVRNLWAFYNQYKENPYSVEILINFQRMTIPSVKENYAEKKQLLTAYEAALSKHPNYLRINCIKYEKEQITQPEFYLNSGPNNTDKTTFIPEEETPINFSYSNIRKLRIECQPIRMTPKELISYYELSDSVLGTPKITINQVLSDTLTLGFKEAQITIPPLKPGYYALHAWADGIELPIWGRVICVTNLFSTSRQNTTNALVVVTDGKSGKPISNARIETYDKDRSYSYHSSLTSIDTYRTDKEGRAFCSEGSLYSVSYGKDKWSSIYPLPSFNRGNRPDKTFDRMDLFTDRSIYRPGQTIHYSGVYYFLDPMNPQVLAGNSVEITLLNNRGKEIYSTRIQTDSLGVFSGSYQLPTSGMTGEYRLKAGAQFKELASTGIRVEEYKRPTFTVEFAPTHIYPFGSPITIKGNAKTYSGIPVGGATVNYRISLFDRGFPLWEREVKTGKVETDDQGNFSILFTPEKEQSGGSISPHTTNRYSIFANVTSTNGETQEGTTGIIVSDASTLVQISAPQKINRGQVTPIAVTVTNAGRDTVRQAIQYRLSLLQDNRDINDIKPLDSLKVAREVLSGNFTSGDSLHIDWSKVASGPYRLSVTCDNVTESRNFVLYSNKEKRPPILTKLWMPEKTQLKLTPGTTTQLYFGSSYKNIYTFYELYSSDTLVEKRIIRLSDEVISIPITYKPEYADNITVYLSFVKDFKMNSTAVTIERENEMNDLVIHAQSFRDRLTPGQTEEWRFTVKDKAGRPVSAAFMSTMFDASLNAIAPHNWLFNPVLFTPRYWGNWINYVENFPELPLYQWEDDFTCEDYQYDRFSIKIPTTYSSELNEVVVVGSGTQRKVSVVGSVTSVNTDYQDSAPMMAKKENAMTANPKQGNSTQPYVQIRTDMAETAFFYPQLVTNAQGEVSVRFKVPDSNTEWQFMALSFTKNLHYGSLNKRAISSKPFMISPNLPRFVRQGDRVSIATSVMNQTDGEVKAKAYLELFDPSTDSILYRQELPAVSLASRATTTINFEITAPDNRDLVGIRIVAQADNFSDGEQHLLPVLPSRSLVTEAKPFITREAGTSTFTLKRLAENKLSDTHSNYRLTLEYTANPTWLAVQALPTLAPPTYDDNVMNILAAFYCSTIANNIISANPRIDSALQVWNSQNADKETLLSTLQQNEQLKSILLSETPWVMQAKSATERMQWLSEVFDRTRLRQRQQESQLRLSMEQKSDGGWSWFKMMESSPYITLSVLEYMARLTQLGAIEYDQAAKEMQIRALNYLDYVLVKSANDKKNKNGVSLNVVTIKYLYVRSYFTDIPISGGAMPWHRQLVNLLKLEWPKMDLRSKAMATIILQRLGFKAEAEKVLRSITEHATRTPEMGMYWDNLRSSQWREEDAIARHAYITLAYNELKPNSPLIAEMKQWLLMQKQTQDWGSNTATADAVFVLLATGPDWLSTETGDAQLKWGGKPVDLTQGDMLTGYTQVVKEGKEIVPADATVMVTTSHNRPAWGAIYWQYFENFEKIEQTSSGIQVSKQLLIEKKTDSGVELLPLSQASVKPGERVTVRLVIRCDRDMEFVHIKDQRAACFAPDSQISGYQFKNNVFYYQENRDAFTNFFFNYLPKGEYVLNYTLWLDRTGVYHSGITSAQCLYAPQFTGHSQGEIIEIK